MSRDQLSVFRTGKCRTAEVVREEGHIVNVSELYKVETLITHVTLLILAVLSFIIINRKFFIKLAKQY